MICAAAALLTACRPVTPPAPAPQVMTTNSDDRVTITTFAEITVIDVISLRGIGAAQVRLTPAQAHGLVQVRFHLRGLEQASFDHGATRLTISVSSHAPDLVLQTLTSNGVTRALDASDAFWAPVALPPDKTPDKMSESPPAPDAIVVTLPAAFSFDASSPLSIHWIDFYR